MLSKIIVILLVPALIAQLLHDPLYGGPALAAVGGHGVHDDPLHVGGEGHPLAGHHCLLKQEGLV